MYMLIISIFYILIFLQLPMCLILEERVTLTSVIWSILIHTTVSIDHSSAGCINKKISYRKCLRTFSKTSLSVTGTILT